MSLFDTGKVYELVGSYEDFTPFLTVPEKSRRFPDKDSEYGKKLIEAGEKFLGYEMKVLPLSLYRRFVEDGNRSEFEGPYFERRFALQSLTVAEVIENSGRFTDKIMDILFAILEETTWVIPAHNHLRENHYKTVIGIMPDNPDNDVWNIDLFSAETAATVAVVFYLMKDKIEKKVGKLMEKRVEYELSRRIVKPYLSYIDIWWMGYRNPIVNNWNPWINANVLTTAAFGVRDTETRKQLARKAAESINFYDSCIPSDGGCDEGPGYFGAAGMQLFCFAETLYSMTDGKYSVFENGHLINIMNYLPRVNIVGDRYFNCADAHPKAVYDGASFMRFGRLSGDKTVYGFGNSLIGKDPFYIRKNYGHFEKGIRDIMYREYSETAEYSAEKYNLLPDIEIASMREYTDTKKGFYIGMKGGHNAESHNHLDVGNVIIYCDGEPVVIDAGVGRYTKFTFMTETRYKMFAFRTEDHNLPLINGKGQWIEKEHHADGFCADFDKKEISVELKEAYINKNEIYSYKRSAALSDGKVTLKDSISLASSGSACFGYLVLQKPVILSDTQVMIGKVKLTVSGGYRLSVTEIPFDDQPSFANDWDTDRLYRILIETKEKEKDIVLVSEFTK